MGREEDTRENKYYACFLLASGIASRRLENHEVFFLTKNNIKGDVYRHENAADGGPSLDLINSVFNQNNDQTES